MEKEKEKETEERRDARKKENSRISNFNFFIEPLISKMDWTKVVEEIERRRLVLELHDLVKDWGK